MQSSSQSADFDPHKDEHYLERLAGVNEDRAVLATENIYNQFGVLLIAAGAPISRRAADHIRNHRLEKPLDQQVDLEGSLAGADILADLYTALETPAFREVHEVNEFDGQLRHLCLSRTMPPLLRQKLSVMKHQMPDEYQHSLLCAWVCGLLAREMKLTPEQSSNVFVCGLIHDIGLLHLPQELLERTGAMSAEQWRAFQSHVVVGRLIVDELDCYDAEVGLGVLEHHERLDRTGFPARKDGSKLSLPGQLVGCADFILKLADNELAGQGRPLKACLSHLKVNHGAFRDDIYRAVFRVMSRDRQSESPVLSSAVLCRRILAVNQQLQELFELQRKFSRHCVGNEMLPPGSAVARVHEMISAVCQTAGLERDSLMQWLPGEGVEHETDPEMHSALLETDSIQYELLWLFKRLGWGLDQLSEPERARISIDGESAGDFQERLNGLLEPGWKQFR